MGCDTPIMTFISLGGIFITACLVALAIWVGNSPDDYHKLCMKNVALRDENDRLKRALERNETK